MLGIKAYKLSRLRSRYRRRLRSRIILGFVLFGFGLTALFAFATSMARERVENQILENMLSETMNSFVKNYLTGKNPNIDFGVQYMRGFVYKPGVSGQDILAQFPEWPGLDTGIHSLSGVDEDGVPFNYMLAVHKVGDTTFYIAYDMTQARKGDEQFKRAIYIAVVVFTLLSLLIGWWSASKVMRPVSELAARLRESGRGSVPERLAPYFVDDEVGEVAKALDDYSDRLTEVVKKDREFNADVSHELRTPLAVIKGAAELLLARSDLDEKSKTRLQRIQRAEQQSTDLINSLLLLSRNERGYGATNVAKVAEQLADALRVQIQASNKDVVVSVKASNEVIVDAPEAAVNVALGNLFGNAVKYTQQGDVVVHVHDNMVDVIDSGPGLSKEDADRLFERGYRGSHAEHTHGGGIGLSIVSRLCDLYGWSVRVVPGKDKGVIATLHFGDSRYLDIQPEQTTNTLE